MANDLSSFISKAVDKFAIYDDLSMMMKRYRDILQAKTPNLSSDSEIQNQFADKSQPRSNGGRINKINNF